MRHKHVTIINVGSGRRNSAIEPAPRDKLDENYFISDLVNGSCTDVEVRRGGDFSYSTTGKSGLKYGGRFTIGPGLQKDWISIYPKDDNCPKFLGRIAIDGTVYGPDGKTPQGQIIISKASTFVKAGEKEPRVVPGLGKFLDERYRSP